MSKKQITVCVTATDIKTGVQGSIHACPIAKALKRHATGPRPRVLGEYCVLKGQKLPLPPKAQNFINDFDTYGDSDAPSYRLSNVRPFKFHLLVSKR